MYSVFPHQVGNALDCWRGCERLSSQRCLCSVFISEVMTMRIAWAIVALLLIFWLLGFTLHIAGGLIHLLLVVALIVLVVDLVSGRRAV